MHSPIEFRPDLQLIMSKKAPEIVRNLQENHISQIQESPHQTQKENMHIQSLSENQVLDQEQQKEVLFVQNQNEKRIQKETSPRNRLRRLQSCKVTHQNSYPDTINYTIGQPEILFKIPRFTQKGCPPENSLVFDCRCEKTGFQVWNPALITEIGVTIYEYDNLFVGSYVCTVTATAKSGHFDNTFAFFLTMETQTTTTNSLIKGRNLNGTLDCTIQSNSSSASTSVSYVIGSPAVSYQYPVYTTSGCPSNNIVQYLFWCEPVGEPCCGQYWWQPNSVTTSVKSISETSSQFVGQWLCTLQVWASDYETNDRSFQLPLTFSSPTDPDPPTNLIVTGATASSIQFSWSPPANSGGLPILNYTISQWNGSYNNQIGSTTSTNFQVNNLSPSTQYWWVVFAHNSFGKSNRSQELSTHPDTPTSLSAILASTTQSQVSFSWTASTQIVSSAVTNYWIEWDQGAGFWDELEPTYTGGNSYTKTGLNSGHIYKFKVQAINLFGGSPFSEEVAITTTATIPDPPTALTGIATQSSVALSWTPSVNNGGSAIIGYEVNWDKGINVWELSNFTTGTSTHKQSLTSGATYKFKVRALNIVGASIFSSEFTITIAATVPDPPTNLTEINPRTNSSSVGLEWTPPANNGGSAITSYEIWWDNGVLGARVYFASTTGSTSLIVKGLDFNKNYQFMVQAINSIGKSTFSAEISFVTPSCKISPDQTFVQVPINYVLGTTQVQFQIPIHTINGCPAGETIDWYRCMCDKEGNPQYWQPNSTGMISSSGGSIYEVDNQYAGSYTCRVYASTTTYLSSTAQTGNGFITASVLTNNLFTFQLTMIVCTAPDPPRDLTATQASTTLTQVSFSWTAPVNNGGQAITGYEIQQEQGTNIWVQLVASQTATSFTKTGLTPSTTCKFKVAAVNSVCRSTFSDQISITSNAEAVPDPPTGLTETVASKTYSQLEFYWSPPANNGGQVVTGYKIYWDQGTNPWIELVNSQTETSFKKTGLSANTAYNFKVAAINSVGTSTFSSVIQITTSVCTMTHSVFEQPAITYILGTAAVSYGIPAYTLSGCGVGETLNDTLSYKISFGAGSIFTISPTGGVIFQNNPSAVGSYTCTVIVTSQPLHLAINSSFIFSLKMITVPNPPTALTEITASKTLTSVSFQWTPPINNGGAVVTSYKIQWHQGTNIGLDYNEVYTGGTSLTIAGLTTGVTYKFQVAANNAAGSSTFTSVLPVIAATVPGPPILFTRNNMNTSTTQIAFSWSAPANNVGSTVTGYEIYWNQGSGSAMQVYDINYTGGTSLTKTTGITAGATYNFQLAAINSIGKSTISSFTIVAATVPSPPTGLIQDYANTNFTQVAFSWTCPQNNGGSAITGYNIQWQLGTNNWTELLASQTASSFTKTGLSASQTFKFKVAAINIIGQSAFSDEIQIQTIIYCSSIQLQTSLPVRLTYTIGSTTQLDYPQYTLLPQNCITNLTYSLVLLSQQTNDFFKDNPTFNQKFSGYPSFIKQNSNGILLQGSDLKESWNSFSFKITATDLNSNISNSSYLFLIQTEPYCLDVKFSLPSLFQKTFSYTMGNSDKQFLLQVIESKSISTEIPFICGPVTIQLNQTDIYSTKLISLPDFIVFDQASQSLTIQANKAKVGTYYLLLDIFFDFFKTMPQQTHLREKIKLQIDNSLLKQFTINATALDIKTASAGQTDQVNPKNETSQDNKDQQKPNEKTTKDFDNAYFSLLSDLALQATYVGPIAGEKMEFTAQFENLVKQRELEDQDYYFYKPTSRKSSKINLDLKAKVDFISSSGLVEIKFNQEVLFPDNFLKMVNYFSNSAQVKRHLCSDCGSSQNLKAEELSLIDQFKEKPLISVGLYMGEYSQYASQNLSYSWNATSVDKINNKFQISLAFDNPEAISATSEPDFIEVKFNYKDFFKNSKGDVLKTENALKIFPTMFKGNFDVVSTFVNTNKIITTTATSTIATIQAALSGSLSPLWNLINVMQMLVCLPLVSVNYPSNALMFNNIFITIANFGVIPVDKFLAKIFKFGPQMPFSQSFYNIGSDSHSLILNLGLPFVILIVSFIFVLPIFWLTKKLGTRYFWLYKISRKLKQQLQYNFYVRMFFEFFLDLAITSLANLYNVKQAWMEDAQWGDKFSVVLAVLFTVVIIILPFWTAYIIHKHKNKFKSDEFVSKYGELAAGLKFEFRYDSVWFLTRRLISAMIIVHFRGLCYFQIMFLAYLQTAQIIYIGVARPFEQRQLNDQHLINEYMVIICIYHLFFFTDWVTTVNPQLTTNAGWSQCAIMSGVMLMSIFRLVWQTLQEIKNTCRKRQIKKFKLQKKQKKTQNASKSSEITPQLIETVQKTIKNDKNPAGTVDSSQQIEAKFRSTSKGKTIKINENDVKQKKVLLQTQIEDKNSQQKQFSQRQTMKNKQLSRRSYKVKKSVSKTLRINKEFKEKKIIEEQNVIAVQRVRQEVQIIVPRRQNEGGFQRMDSEAYEREVIRRLDMRDARKARLKNNMLLSVSNDSQIFDDSRDGQLFQL